MLYRQQCRLRRMRDDDLQMVLRWRNSDRIRKNMYTDHIISQNEHQSWYDRIKATSEQIPYIFEIDERPIGFFNVTDIDRDNLRCGFGLYVGESDMPRGTGTALGYCAMEEIFERLGFQRIVGEVFSFNKATIEFNMRLGFTHEAQNVRQVQKNGKDEEILIFDLYRDGWLKRKPELAKIVFMEETVECIQ